MEIQLWPVAAVLCFAMSPVIATGQQDVPELTGTVSFDVASRSGRVEKIAVQIGDGGTGKYKAILTGDPGLPTHGIWRPRDLRPFNAKNPLPIVAFGNGGCRNTSGEFRNFLSDVASQGFLIVSIGPAGNAVVMGSEERTNTTVSSQLLDGVTWAIAENERAGSIYFGKLDVTKIAVSGQSCGAQQALDVSADPRVTTTIAQNQGLNMGGGRGGGGGRGPNPAGAPGAAVPNPNTPPPDRYAPSAPALVRADGPGRGPGNPNRADVLQKLHGPVLFLNGGPKDSGHNSAKANFEAINHVPAVHAYQEVGHYPATYRQPNGGAFAKTVGAWLKWQLKGDMTAAKMFTGEACGLCTDTTWTIERKNLK